MTVRMAEGDGATDDDLLAAIAGGDSHAMQRLYRRHSARVYRFALGFVKDSAMAEDVTNDVFIEVYRSAARFEGRSQVSTWLLGMARFKALSSRRRRRDMEDADDALVAMEDGGDDPEVAAQKKDKAAALRRCIERLSVEHREIIDLVYFHEKPIREIAAIVGIPENTVKTRMFHARRKLSELMAKAGIDRGWP